MKGSVIVEISKNDMKFIGLWYMHCRSFIINLFYFSVLMKLSEEFLFEKTKIVSLGRSLNKFWKNTAPVFFYVEDNKTYVLPFYFILYSQNFVELKKIRSKF